MTPFSALADGIRRVNRAPAILAVAWALTVLISLPLALSLRASLGRHLGGSLAADLAAGGINYEWIQEFSDQASGMGVTVQPTIVGFGAVLDTMSGLLDNTHRPMVIVSAAAGYVALWAFAAGAIIERYARDRSTGARHFLSSAGTYGGRFLRLVVIQLIVYAVLFHYVHAWLFDSLYPRLIADLTVARTVVFVRAGLYLAFGLLLAACALVFDYAKVRAVIEGRRSMTGSVRSAIWFIRRNAVAAVALYAADLVLFGCVVGIYGQITPGSGGNGPLVWAAFAVGQLYVLARLWIKLVFWASETALFQGRLARAGYVAAVP